MFLRSLNLCLRGFGRLSWSVAQPAPSWLLERLETGDLFGEISVGACGLVGVSFPVDIVLSTESGVVGLGEADITGPLVLAFLAGWSLEGGESLFLALLAVLVLVMGSSRPLGKRELGGRDHWAGGGVGWLGDTS